MSQQQRQKIKLEPKMESVIQVKLPMVRDYSTGGGHAPGDTLEWRMVLIGRAVEWFPYVVMSARLMGEQGVGGQAGGGGDRRGGRGL